MHWHIALTQPGQDRQACDALRNARYLVYRPILPVMVRHGRGMMRSVIKSMFPGYLFIRDEFAQGWLALSRARGMRGTRSLLIMNGKLTTVDDALLDEVKAEEVRQCTVDLKGNKIALSYKVGDRVRIEDNSFSGIFGRVAELDDIERICLLVRILGRESRVYVSHEHLTAS
jgi:transcription antitermination factor NusG